MIILGFVIVVIQILDLSAGDTWTLNLARVSSEQMTSYSILTLTSLALQVLLLLKTTSIVIRAKKVTSQLALIIGFVYFASNILVIILLCYLLGEQLVYSEYHILLSKLIVGISLIMSSVVMVSLAFKCLRSYLSTRSMMTAVYSIAIITISIQMICAFLYIEASLNSKPELITPARNPWMSYFYTNFVNALLSVYEIATIVSFVSVWIASVLLTRSYVKKIGRVKSYLTVTIPIIYFLFQYSPAILNHTGALSSLLMANGSLFSYFYNFILNTAHVGAGVLFGISFFILSRALNNISLKYYLVLCGTGIMIIFSNAVSTSSILAPFPAWSIASITFILPASFIITVGLDSAAQQVAGDMKVRKYLNKFKKEFELLTALGSREAYAIIERKVQSMSKQIYDELETESSYVTKPNMEEIKGYVNEVIKEVKKSNNELNSS